MIPERKRLTLALLLSLLIHTLLLRLTFGGLGLWPGFALPWQDRRIEVPDLRVVLAPAPIPAAEPAPSVLDAPIPERLAAQRVPEAHPRVEARPGTAAHPGTVAATDAAPAEARSGADRPGDPAAPPIPVPAVIASARTDETTWVIPAPAQAVMPPLLPDAGDAALAENARLEAERQEAARIEADRVEAARVEAARVEAERVEAARVEAERVEAARVEAGLLETERQETARVEAARLEAERQEAARIKAAKVEAARLEAARQEAARIKAATLEAARVEAEQEDARREARRRALGRQLDAEADRRDAARAAARQSPSWSTARRYRLLGRADPNAEIVRYAEVWSRKIEMNMALDMVRDAAKERHTDPLVTVALRSDGSVESVTFVLSSGVAAIDEAVRRIVESQAPYPVFPPGLAQEYDVIEIRRSWHFDIAVRLY